MKTIRPIPTSIALAICWAASSFAQDFVSNQFADVVIGKANFTVNIPITASASTTGTTSDAVVDPTTGELFVVDTGNNRVLRFSSTAAATIGASAQAVFGQPDLTTGTANTGGLSATSLNDPTGIYIDANGALWVADTGNNRVLRFAAAASISADGANATAVLGQLNFTASAAATTQAGLSGPRGIAINSAGRLWVSDSGNNRVLWYDNASAQANGSAANGVLGHASFTASASGLSSQQLNTPLGVSQDASGHLWIADSGNARVLRFSALQAPPTTLIPPVIRLIGHPRIFFPAASQQIRGRASDSDGVVVAVEGSINGRPFTLAKGTTSWRFHAHKLRKGVNIIRLVAIDNDGLQSNTLIVRIIRRTPNFWR